MIAGSLRKHEDSGCSWGRKALRYLVHNSTKDRNCSKRKRKAEIRENTNMPCSQKNKTKKKKPHISTEKTQRRLSRNDALHYRKPAAKPGLVEVKGTCPSPRPQSSLLFQKEPLTDMFGIWPPKQSSCLSFNALLGKVMLWDFFPPIFMSGLSKTGLDLKLSTWS